MGACERRIFVTAVGISVTCILVLSVTGYMNESYVAGGWQTFQENNTLSAYVNLKSTSDWLVKAVGNVIDNDKGSSSISMSNPILILYWTTVFNKPWDWGASPLSTCTELAGRCEFTSNHSRIEESDLLIFHMLDKLNLPLHHLPRQKWVFSVMESPSQTFANFPRLQGTFNLTMTYARTAQVSWVYGLCEPLPPNTISKYGKTFNYAGRKRHRVAWFVSHCKTQSRRETYVQVLGKHIDVHTHGCGGKYNCPKSKMSICNRRLNDDYKFYLSFENSICRDYVTEKLWKILQLNVVPIVLGNANYSDLLPPHSYIDVGDFASPRHLADYLKLLDANDRLYNEYFRWREMYVCPMTRMRKNNTRGCDLCRHAVATRGKTEIVKDLVAEWGSDQNCISPKQYYRGMEEYL